MKNSLARSVPTPNVVDEALGLDVADEAEFDPLRELQCDELPVCMAIHPMPSQSVRHDLGFARYGQRRQVDFEFPDLSEVECGELHHPVGEAGRVLELSPRLRKVGAIDDPLHLAPAYLDKLGIGSDRSHTSDLYHAPGALEEKL